MVRDDDQQLFDSVRYVFGSIGVGSGFVVFTGSASKLRIEHSHKCHPKLPSVVLIVLKPQIGTAFLPIHVRMIFEKGERVHGELVENNVYAIHPPAPCSLEV